MYYTYIIQSEKTGNYYIGSTKSIPERIRRHNCGFTKSTKGKGPFRLIYQEVYHTRVKAYSRERQIKNYKGGQAFKRLIQT